MADFEQTSKAFHAARSRASVASAAEALTLHMASRDAREAGLSVAAAAAALRVPQSEVSRHWGEDHRCGQELPVWGSADEYLAAEQAIWAHAPEKMELRVPYEWTEAPGGGRGVRLAAAEVSR